MNFTPSSKSFISSFANKVVREILRFCDAKHFSGEIIHVWVVNEEGRAKEME